MLVFWSEILRIAASSDFLLCQYCAPLLNHAFLWWIRLRCLCFFISLLLMSLLHQRHFYISFVLQSIFLFSIMLLPIFEFFSQSVRLITGNVFVIFSEPGPLFRAESWQRHLVVELNTLWELRTTLTAVSLRAHLWTFGAFELLLTVVFVIRCRLHLSLIILINYPKQKLLK